MDYLQYYKSSSKGIWVAGLVLNLIINGLPSILKRIEFKLEEEIINLLLNLIINGLPSIPKIF